MADPVSIDHHNAIQLITLDNTNVSNSGAENNESRGDQDSNISHSRDKESDISHSRSKKSDNSHRKDSDISQSHSRSGNDDTPDPDRDMKCAFSACYALTITMAIVSLHLSNAYNDEKTPDVTLYVASICMSIGGLVSIGFLFRACLREKRGGDMVIDHDNGDLYLRAGAVLFCLGTIFHHLLMMAEQIELNVVCDTDMKVAYFIQVALTCIVQVAQLFFLLKCSKICLQRDEFLTKLSIGHLMASNVVIWIQTVIRENMEIIEFIGQDLGTESKEVSQEDNELSCVKREQFKFSDLERDMSSILFPATIEYSLIAAGCLFIMWINFGHRKIAESGIVTKHPLYKQTYNIAFHCKGSSIGLIVGISAVLLQMTAFTLFVINVDDGINVASWSFTLIYAIIIACLNLAMTIAAIIAMVLMRQHEKSEEVPVFDMLLIFVSLCGMQLYNFFSIYSGLLLDVYPLNVSTVLNYGIQFVQCLTQTIFIRDALSRKSDLKLELASRNFVVFLLLANVALWIDAMFLMKRADANPLPILLYNPTQWSVTIGMIGPLMIFYRFHSTATLFTIWRHAYA